MSGVWEFKLEWKFIDVECKKEINNFIVLVDQKIVDYKNFRRNVV